MSVQATIILPGTIGDPTVTRTIDGRIGTIGIGHIITGATIELLALSYSDAVTPAATPRAQATPSAQVEPPRLTTPTPSPSQPAATSGPSLAQPVATPGGSPIQPVATPAPSAPVPEPSVAPTSTASPEATDSDSPTDRYRRPRHRRLHHRQGQESELPQT
jgi:hypothetical protein